MHKKTTLFASTILALSLAASAAYAAEVTNVIEELVVTAEKREQSLQDVPVAISAFTSQRRDLLGITSIADITNFTPGLTYSAGTDRITLRGIGRLTNNLASEPGVANYSDNVYTSSTLEAGKSPLFAERVEVLRGPQGTLYGRNSIGGAINVISKRPTKEFQGEVRVDAASYDRQEFAAYISGPLADNLRYRLSAQRVKQEGGYFRNLSGGPDEGGVTDNFYLEGQLQAELGEHVDAWIKYAKGGYNNLGAPGGGHSGGSYTPTDTALFTPGSLSPGAGFAFGPTATNVVALGPARGNPALQTGDLRTFSTNIPNRAKLNHNDQLSTEVTWHAPSVDLKYTGGYQRYVYRLQTDFDNTAVLSYTIPLQAGPSTCAAVPTCRPLTFAPNVVSNYVEDKKWWSHELNLSSTTDGPVQWIVGAYMYHEYYHQPVIIDEPDVPQLATPTSGAAPNPERTIYYSDQFMNAESRAAFGQVDWKFADQWKLTLGIRYTKDKKKGYESARQLCFGLPVCTLLIPNLGTLTPALDITPTGAPSPLLNGAFSPGVVGLSTLNTTSGVRSRGLADSWDAWTGTAGVEWKPDDRTLTYAKYSRGYKAGGFNSGTLSTFVETDSESIDASELGVKRDWSPTLQTNISAFYYLYDNAQVPVTYQPTVGPQQSVFYNIPESVSLGLELESIWRPIDNLQILFNYAYLDAHIEKSDPIVDSADGTAREPGARPVAGTAQDTSGNPLPLSPKNKVSFNANYTWQFSPGSLVTSASYLWRDEVYSSIFKRYYNRSADRSQIDLRATWRDTDNRYSIVGYVQNLLDTTEYESRSATRNSAGVLNRNYTLTLPRTYGVQVQYRF